MGIRQLSQRLPITYDVTRAKNQLMLMLIVILLVDLYW